MFKDFIVCSHMRHYRTRNRCVYAKYFIFMSTVTMMTCILFNSKQCFKLEFDQIIKLPTFDYWLQVTMAHDLFFLLHLIGGTLK